MLDQRVSIDDFGDADLRQLLATYADLSGQVQLECVARIVDQRIREIFDWSGDIESSSGIGVRFWNNSGVGLSETVKLMAKAPDDLVAKVVSALLSDKSQMRRHNSAQRYSNLLERSASLRSWWSDLSTGARYSGPLGSGKCDAYMRDFLGKIESLAPQCFSTLKRGTKLFRARYIQDFNAFHDQLRSSMEQALSAPPAHAASAQRLNPSRVPCFYGALDEATCLSELRLASGWLVVIGEFDVIADIAVLDVQSLRTLDQPTNYFSRDYERRVSEVGTLRGLPAEICEPSWPGDDESHYIPTIYFAEYLRVHERSRICGLVYPSAQRREGTNVALFADVPLHGSSGSVRFRKAYSMRVVSTAVETRAEGLSIENVEPRSCSTKGFRRKKRTATF